MVVWSRHAPKRCERKLSQSNLLRFIWRLDSTEARKVKLNAEVIETGILLLPAAIYKIFLPAEIIIGCFLSLRV
ncbi:hypothetical protein V6N13_113190 [Hibiscus sabdariffa]